MKTKIVPLFIFFTLLLGGCKRSLLDVKNENTYTDESYFKTQTQFNEAIVATYAVFNHQGMMSREWYFIFDLIANDAERASPLVGTELQLTDQLRVGYSYAITTGAIQQAELGSHELLVQYRFRYSAKGVITPRYF